jgi:hypothetical protein
VTRCWRLTVEQDVPPGRGIALGQALDVAEQPDPVGPTMQTTSPARTVSTTPSAAPDLSCPRIKVSAVTCAVARRAIAATSSINCAMWWKRARSWTVHFLELDTSRHMKWMVSSENWSVEHL